jgi:hypothetical protein
VVAGVALLGPALAWAHERWVPHEAAPYDHSYFEHMTGEVLRWSLLATAALAGVILLWYLVVLDFVERLTPATEEARRREAALPLPKRLFRRGLRFALDGDVEHPWLARGERIAVLVFARLPAAVLLLGVWEGWIVMPSFPLPEGAYGTALRVVAAALAAWVLAGVALPALGATLFAVFIFLCVEYGSAAVDAIPVLASAFFYLFSRPGATELDPRQIAGIRLSLGVGFFLLGLVNKIGDAGLFIGVGDQHPHLIESARKLIPDLSREGWSFTTALGEMFFGLMLLLGLFDKMTTLALAGIFTHFMFTFGWREVVHVYPIAGFAILFFHAPPGTVLDGLIFRSHVAAWRISGHSVSAAVHVVAVALVAAVVATVLMFGPLFAVIHVIPRL